MVLLDEYLELCHSAKIELLSDRLIVGESDNHTRHLFQQILRGWGLEAAIALQPTLKSKQPKTITSAYGNESYSTVPISKSSPHNGLLKRSMPNGNVPQPNQFDRSSQLQNQSTKNLGSEPPPFRGTFKIYRTSFADLPMLPMTNVLS